MRTPSWDDVRAFLRIDGWSQDRQRSTDHDHFVRTLADGEFLITRVSRAGTKSMSPGRFYAILVDQLRVNEAQFWEVLRTKEPASRPSPVPEVAPVSLPLWLARELERRGVPARDIEVLDAAAATSLLDSLRTRPNT